MSSGLNPLSQSDKYSTALFHKNQDCNVFPIAITNVKFCNFLFCGIFFILKQFCHFINNICVCILTNFTVMPSTISRKIIFHTLKASIFTKIIRIHFVKSIVLSGTVYFVNAVETLSFFFIYLVGPIIRQGTNLSLYV